MKPTKVILFAAPVLLLFVAGAIFYTQKQAEATPTVVVYKSPTCGCCSKWIDHLEQAGFEVEAHDLDNVSPIKAQYGVQRPLQSCHTAIVDGYVVEGHVPAEHVQRLLEERPDVAGIAVPGMPIGSPGMEGPNPQAYDVLAFDESGRTQVFARVEP